MTRLSKRRAGSAQPVSSSRVYEFSNELFEILKCSLIVRFSAMRKGVVWELPRMARVLLMLGILKYMEVPQTHLQVSVGYK